METTAAVWESGEVGAGAGPDARRSRRTRMIKAAGIAFGGAVLDCVLLDASPVGAQVFLKSPVDVPDLATLRLPDGESRPVRCRWQVGPLVGLEILGAAPLVVPAA